MKKSSLVLSISAILLLSAKAGSAPFPVTSSSILTKPDSGLFWLSRGFSIGTEGTAWKMIEPEIKGDFKKVANSGLDHADYRHPDFPKGQFQLRVENLKSDATIDTYSKKWSKDYDHYGLSVQATHPFTQGDQQGLIYDLASKGHKLKVRQIVLVHKSKAVIMTCTEEKDNFVNFVKQCNEMVRRFKWAKADEPVRKEINN